MVSGFPRAGALAVGALLILSGCNVASSPLAEAPADAARSEQADNTVVASAGGPEPASLASQNSAPSAPGVHPLRGGSAR